MGLSGGFFVLLPVLGVYCYKYREERQDNHDYLIIRHTKRPLSHLYAAAKGSPPAAPACLHDVIIACHGQADKYSPVQIYILLTIFCRSG